MQSGDCHGLQNRRAAGHPVTGGFDPHSLPPFSQFGLLSVGKYGDGLRDYIALLSSRGNISLRNRRRGAPFLASFARSGLSMHPSQTAIPRPTLRQRRCLAAGLLTLDP